MKLYLSKLLTLIFYLVGPAIAGIIYQCREHFFTFHAVNAAVHKAVNEGNHMKEITTLLGRPRFRVFVDLINDYSGSAAFAIITRKSHKVKSVMVLDEEGQWETCSYRYASKKLINDEWARIPGATDSS
ncbi:unnamed protein product [Blumeria hordei]|uniref:Uncharacterized protein n=1 Tax=Blumeria hordei TaxID=2867405 RepID=A0A383V1E0_BLUHO|nr:unnamed protein product [Blumeria hordei]